MQPLLCHDQPEIFSRLILDVSKDASVIWGHEGGGNNKIQMMLDRYKKIMTTCSNFSLSAYHHFAA
jgi:hypothetical protein